MNSPENAENPLKRLLELSELEAVAQGARFTPREIAQQPRVWLDTCERVHARRSELDAFLGEAGVFGANPPHLVLIGAGSSDWVGLLTASSFRECWTGEVSVWPSTDLMTQRLAEVLFGSHYLFVYFSRSGETAEAVTVLRRLQRELPSAHHLIVTCNQNGELVRAAPAQRSLVVALDPATNDRGLAMTSSFSSMALAALSLAHLHEGEVLGTGMQALASAGERVLSDMPRALRRLAGLRHAKACFLGSGRLRAVAGEAALKLLELTAGRVSTFHESFLGVRHGPLAALDEHTLLLGFLSSELSERAHELDLIEEVVGKRLAGHVVLVVAGEDARASALANEVLVLPELPLLPVAFPSLLAVLVAQLLALFASIEQGLLPDSPSPNGAIQRVVSGLRQH